MASIDQVAKACGLSTATVSRVFNRRGNVKEPTRQLVLRVAEEMGYSPRITARTDCVAILVESMKIFASGGYANQMLAALMHEISLNGMRAEVIPVPDVAIVSDGFIRGAVALLYTRGLLAKERFPDGFPVVSVNEVVEGVTSVVSDDGQGMMLALEKLAEQGHERIGLLTRSVARAGSFESVAAELGLAALVQHWHGEPVTDLVAKALKQRPTALIAAHEDLGPPVAYALHLLGVSVPGEISLIGFEREGASAYLIPPQTTLLQDYSAIARASVKAIMARSDAGIIRIPYSLIERESVGVHNE